MVTSSLYGVTRKGEKVYAFSLMNKNGVEVRTISFGCRITHILLPDERPRPTDIVLGFDTLAEYEADHSFQGAVVGRFANRIAGAKYTLEGRTCTLLKNDGNNYLHGHMDQHVWKPEIVGESSVRFTTTSPAGEDGFPGNVRAGVTYTLSDSNELSLDYRAVTDEATPINLTNHTYFNLAGPFSESVLNQKLWLGSRSFLETNSELLPTGRALRVDNTPFDFRTEKLVGRDIRVDDPQLLIADGYDHCFLLAKPTPGQLSLAAVLTDPASRASMRMYTTQPAVQLYTGNFLDAHTKGKRKRPFLPKSALCLETQGCPDAPNQPRFPSSILQPGGRYHHATVFKFFY